MPVSATEDRMNQQQLDELSAVMSMTSDRVIAAYQRCVPVLRTISHDMVRSMYVFGRALYAASIIDTPMSRHPMTARKVRGCIRRLKAGEIGPNRIRPKVIVLMEQSMRERPDIWQRFAER